jgi:hypothetical protein
LLSKSLTARADLRLLLLPFLLLVNILPFDPLLRLGASFVAVAGIAALAADGSFEDVCDGISRMEDFFFGPSDGTSFPCLAARCDCGAEELSGTGSCVVVASWTVSVVAHQYRSQSSRNSRYLDCPDSVMSRHTLNSAPLSGWIEARIVTTHLGQTTAFAGLLSLVAQFVKSSV